MSKRFLLITGGLLVVGSLAWLGVTWFVRGDIRGDAPLTDRDFAKARRKVNLGLPAHPAVVPEKSIAPSQPVRLAIGGLGLARDAESGQLADLLAAQLTGAKGLELVERRELDQVLRELELSRSGLVRAKDALRVGQLVKADWFLLGSRASAGGTNFLVARVVDARTGAMRDVAVVRGGANLIQTASELADFVRDCRQAASTPRPRVFLAIGGFVNVSFNGRQADFPEHLQAYLTGAYRNGKVTLLEREMVDTLLQEVRLDLAGLTAEKATNGAPALQSAFWLVNGYFQSYETADSDVELQVQVNRIFGRATRTSLRGRADESLFRQVREFVDATLANPAMLVPTRWNEIREQMEMGKDLMTALSQYARDPFDLISATGSLWGTDEAGPKRGHNLEEAIRSFQTVLLLDPDNFEAKMRLGACLHDSSIGRVAEARNCYREVADSPTAGKWRAEASLLLGYSYGGEDDDQAARWFRQAIQSPPGNPFAGTAQTMLQKLLLTQSQAAGVIDPEMLARAEQTLMENTRSFCAAQRGKEGLPTADPTPGLYAFASVFGTNTQAAAKRVVELLPKLKRECPDLEPHFLAAVAALQTDTNAPIIAEFRKSLAECRQHPKDLRYAQAYFANLASSICDGCTRLRLYSLAVECVEAKRQAALPPPDLATDLREKVQLAFLYLRLERYRDALTIFEDLGELPVAMQNDGIWGNAWTPLLPAKLAAGCREKLGLPPVQIAGRFDFGDPCLRLPASAPFVLAENSLWLALPGKLLQLDFDLHTDFVIALPAGADAPVSALCVGQDRLWIGTEGAGLVEFDKTNRVCRRLTEKDGLLLDDVTCLCLLGESLWIGFGRGNVVGGVGRLDLPTGRISSFATAMPSDPARVKPLEGWGQGSTEPPKRMARAMVGLADDLWVATDGIRHYRVAEQKWDLVPGSVQNYGFLVIPVPGRLLACISEPQVTVEFFDNGGGAGVDPAGSNSAIGVLSALARSGAGALKRPPRPFLPAGAAYSVGRGTNLGPATRVVLPLGQWDRLKVGGKLPPQVASWNTMDQPPKHTLCELPTGATEWKAIGEDAELPAPATFLTLDGANLWLGGEGYIEVFDLAQKKVRALSRIPARVVNSIQFGGGFVWAGLDQCLYRVALSKVP